MTPREDYPKTIETVRKYLASLKAEKGARGGSLPQDDERIATEIAAHMFQLGYYAHDWRDSIARYESGIKKARQHIGDIKSLTEQLQIELNCVIHKFPPRKKALQHK